VTLLLLLLLRLVVVEVARQHTAARLALWTTRSACVTRLAQGHLARSARQDCGAGSCVHQFGTPRRDRLAGCSRPSGLSAVRQPVTPPGLGHVVGAARP